MKKHMAHVLILEFYEETVSDRKKIDLKFIEGPDGHQNIMYSNSYLMRSMEMSLTMFTMGS